MVNQGLKPKKADTLINGPVSIGSASMAPVLQHRKCQIYRLQRQQMYVELAFFKAQTINFIVKLKPKKSNYSRHL